MVDNKMNKNAIVFLKWGVNLYTFAAYWFLTNRQIFYNDISPISRWSAIEITNHSIYNIPFDYTFPLLLVAFVILITMSLQACGLICVWAAFDDSIKEELRGVENLFSFYDSLSLDDIDWILSEEKYIVEKLGYFKMSDKQKNSYHFGKIKRRQTSLTDDEIKLLDDKTIFNHPCYDLLFLAKYMDKFQYVPYKHRQSKNLQR